MSDLLLDALPTRWAGREIDPDYRPMVWLISSYARGVPDKEPLEFAGQAIRRFYKRPDDLLETPERAMDAYRHLLEFCTAGEAASSAGHADNAPDSGLAFDYLCDAPYIVAAFQQAYGIDLTAERVHWFRFRALFAALPEDTLMAKIMGWRTMDLSEYEGSMRAHYASLKERFALPAGLRGGAAVAQTVAEHDAAFLARFRR